MSAATPPMDEKGEVLAMLMRHVLGRDYKVYAIAAYADNLAVIDEYLAGPSMGVLGRKALGHVVNQLLKETEELRDWYDRVLELAKAASESPQRLASG